MDKPHQDKRVPDFLDERTLERYVSKDELRLLYEVGIYEDEESWASFIKSRKAVSLDHARPIDMNLMATGVESVSGIDQVVKLVKSKTNKRVYQPTRHQANCLLANLFLNYSQSPTLWAIVSRAHQVSTIKKYNPMRLNNEALARLCDILVDLNFLEKEIGFRETGKGKRDGFLTRVRATDDLINLLEHFGWTHEILQYHPDTVPIVMKAKVEGQKSTKPVSYSDNELTKGNSNLLWTYHNFLRAHEVLLPTPTGDRVADLIFMRQIFSNNSWMEGGRLFGGAYQQLSKQEREKITIDGEPICEIDIASCHPTMVFAEAGLDWHRQYDEDIYQRDDLSQWPREVIKRAFNIAINAKDEKTAAAALTFTNNNEGWLDNHKDLQTPGWQKSLLDGISQAYPEIRHLFFRGRGMYYMRQEGEIGLLVIQACMERGIPVLTLHDSFIAPERYQTVLKEAISQTFERVVGATCKLR